MEASSLSDFVESMSQREFAELHKRWLIYVGLLIGQQGCRGRLDAVEIVNETFVSIATGAKGYVCPPDEKFGDFFIKKLRTSTERLAKRSKRDRKRLTEFKDYNTPLLYETEEFADRASNLALKLSCEMGSRTGGGLLEYIKVMPLIIAGGFDQADAANLLNKTAGNLANYRYRLEQRFIHPTAPKKHGK